MIDDDYEKLKLLVFLVLFFTMLTPLLLTGNVISSLIIFVVIWIPIFISFFLSYLDYKKSPSTSYKKYWILNQYLDTNQ